MSNLVRFDPFEEMRSLQRQFFGDDWFSSPRQLKTMSIPTTDVYTEDDKRMVVEAHLPNFDEKDIDINVDKGVLVIRAEKHESEEDKKKGKKYIVRESSSSFYRSIALPEHAEENKIEAHMKEGVLKVIVPFKELPKPKKIAIKSKN